MTSVVRGVAAVCVCGACAVAGGQMMEPPALEIEMHNAGRSPRALLLYDVAPGTDETMTMRIELEQSVDMGAVAQRMVLPTIVVEVGIETAAEFREGEIEAGFGFDAIAFESREGVPDGLTEMMRTGLDGFGGVTGRLVIDEEGRVLDLMKEPAAGAPAFLEQSFLQISSAFRGVITPLPGVPVGVGASWTVAMDLDFGQVTMRQETVYTLRSVEGDIVTLGVQVGQTAAAGTTVEDAQGEWESTVSEAVGGGEGVVVLSLKRIAPVRTDVTVGNRVVIDSTAVGGGGVSQTAMDSSTRVVTEGVVVK